MSEQYEKIIILGAGVTGLVSALELSRKYGERIILVEKEAVVGGLAATFHEKGLSFDFGSHRIHPNISDKIMKYIIHDLKTQMLDRQRRGKLYIKGKYLKYPPCFFNTIKEFPARMIMDFIKEFRKIRP